ncbi:MAG: serine/threonine protein kinase [Treponema sp.]|nr:serine/threonine protein kinase [Treponema sp.]
MAENDFPPVIGKYKVQGVIAKGGMGVVYKAIHPSLKRYVVIKKMTSRGNAANAERFKKEAQILLDLQSPYIVHLFDYFTEGSYRYMVEELVDGIALDKLIKKQTVLPPPVAMLFLQDACFALKYAHSKDIVHRDIKPGNILISKRGEIKLADFGIASDIAEKEGEGLTQTGVTLGTPAYMPPEQFEDSTSVDNRADIYALGIMLYEMVTGTKPYSGEFSYENLKIIQKGKYIPPRKIDKTIPKEISKLIQKMIRPNPKKRFQSVDGVIKAVKKYLKHYDTHDIRVHIARSVVISEFYEYPNFIQKDKKARLIKRISLWLCSLGVLFIALWEGGVIHRTVLRKWYTPVSVKMEMPHSLSAYLDLPVRAFFFENDNDKIPEVKGARLTLQPEGTWRYQKLFTFTKDEMTVTRLASKNKIYDSADVFLKKGDYRVKVVVGPYIWWKSFTVDGEPLVLEEDFLKNTTRKLQISTFVSDADSGEDITAQTYIYILYNGKWVPLNSIDEEKLKTGTVWKIKVEAFDYEPEVFSLLIDWYQDRLFISSQLKKK